MHVQILKGTKITSSDTQTLSQIQSILITIKDKAKDKEILIKDKTEVEIEGREGQVIEVEITK